MISGWEHLNKSRDFKIRYECGVARSPRRATSTSSFALRHVATDGAGQGLQHFRLLESVSQFSHMAHSPSCPSASAPQPATSFSFPRQMSREGERGFDPRFGSGSGGRRRHRHLSAQSGVAKAGHSVQQDWRSFVTLRSSSIISIFQRHTDTAGVKSASLEGLS